MGIHRDDVPERVTNNQKKERNTVDTIATIILHNAESPFDVLTDLGYTVTDEDTELFWIRDEAYDYIDQLIKDDPDLDPDPDRVPNWALDLLEEALEESPPTIENVISTNPRTTRLYDIAGYAVLIDSETLYVETIGRMET